MIMHKLVATERGMDWVDSQFAGEPAMDEAVEVILSLDELVSDVTFDPSTEKVNTLYDRYKEEYLGSCDEDHLPSSETFFRCWNQGWIAGEEVDVS